MQRSFCALAVIIAATGSQALAETPQARIYTRDSVRTVTGPQSHYLHGQPLNNQFPLHGTTLDSTSVFNFGGKPLLYNNGSFFQRPTAANTRLLPHVVVIERPVAVPAATVSRELAQQPVHPHLIEMFILGEGQPQSSTIYLDPDVNYQLQGRLELDSNHSILQAQRLARSLRARPATIVYGSPKAAGRVEATSVKPHVILQKPDADGFTVPPTLKPKDTQQLVSLD